MNFYIQAYKKDRLKQPRAETNNGHVKTNGVANGHVKMNGHASIETTLTNGYVKNGYANGHANGHVNGHANGHANSYANGHANGYTNGHANGHISSETEQKEKIH